MSTGEKRAHEEDPSVQEPPKSMPRIETDPVDAAIQKATQDYPVGPERLTAIRKATCSMPPVPKATMSGGAVRFGADDWLKVSDVVADATVWGASPDYSDSPGAKNVAKAKLEATPEFTTWFMAMWDAIVDCIVENAGGPNVSKKVKAKLEGAKSQDEKRAIVADALKLHCPLKDGTLTVKVKLIAEGDPKAGDDEAVKSFPPLTQEEFKRGGFQVAAKPMMALDGKTQIPLYKVLDPAQGRPVFVGQVRFELAIKTEIKPDGKRVCVLPTAADFQLISMKSPDGGAREAMPNLENL